MNKPTPVRIRTEALEQLAEIAQTNGLSTAELIRIAVDNLLDQIDKDGRLEVVQIVQAPAGKYSTDDTRKKRPRRP